MGIGKLVKNPFAKAPVVEEIVGPPVTTDIPVTEEVAERAAIEAQSETATLGGVEEQEMRDAEAKLAEAKARVEEAKLAEEVKKSEQQVKDTPANLGDKPQEKEISIQDVLESHELRLQKIEFNLRLIP